MLKFLLCILALIITVGLYCCLRIASLCDKQMEEEQKNKVTETNSL